MILNSLINYECAILECRPKLIYWSQELEYDNKVNLMYSRDLEKIISFICNFSSKTYEKNYNNLIVSNVQIPNPKFKYLLLPGTLKTSCSNSKSLFNPFLSKNNTDENLPSLKSLPAGYL